MRGAFGRSLLRSCQPSRSYCHARFCPRSGNGCERRRLSSPPMYTRKRRRIWMSLQKWLRANGLPHDLLVMQLNGGCARARQALRIPVNLIRSGPAATPAAARQIARRIDASDVIAVDMGGTSFDVCLMRGGELPLSRRAFTAHQPLGVPAVEVESIGAGGGSIAWVDSGGVLRVGPQSAGAAPGPAGYGAGGSRPTVTDANIVLGYLPTHGFLGGRRTLRHDLAEQAIQKHVADPLGLASVQQAAAGIIRIVDDNMASAIRAVTIERGIDPRPCVIISGGGAGSLHAGRLAAIMGIRRVVVPSQAGTLSAFGMTVTNVRHEYSATLHTTTRQSNWDGVDRLLRELEDRAVAEVEKSGFRARIFASSGPWTHVTSASFMNSLVPSRMVK